VKGIDFGFGLIKEFSEHDDLDACRTKGATNTFCPPRRAIILLFFYINDFDLGEQYIYKLCVF